MKETRSAPAPPPRFIEEGDTRRDIASQKPRGELLGFDSVTRKGTFKSSADGTIRDFIALPHVVCLHHCATGDMRDYRIGERLRFIVHENKDGQWNLLGLVSEELYESVSHNEPYYVDQINSAKGLLTVTRRKREGDKIVWPGMSITTNHETRYWKKGVPDARFSDIEVGMPLWMKTYGGEGLMDRNVWDVFLDDESIESLKQQQTLAHVQRLAREGLPGYVDRVDARTVHLTLFPEVMDYFLNKSGGSKKEKGAKRGLKPQQHVKLSLAGPDRVPVGEKLSGKVIGLRPYIKHQNYICEVTIELDESAPKDYQPARIARVWPE